MSTKIIDWLDKPRRVTFDLQAIMDAEAFLGVGLQRAQIDLPGPRLFVVLLYFGLAREDSSLSLRSVSEMVNKALESKKITGRNLQDFVMETCAASAAFSGFERDKPEGGEAVPLLESSTTD